MNICPSISDGTHSNDVGRVDKKAFTVPCLGDHFQINTSISSGPHKFSAHDLSSGCKQTVPEAKSALSDEYARTGTPPHFQ